MRKLVYWDSNVMIYNRHLNKYIIVTEGEYYCDLCKGRGKVKQEKIKLPFEVKFHDLVCHKCLGTGVLDWIEKAIGKRMTSQTSSYCLVR